MGFQGSKERGRRRDGNRGVKRPQSPLCSEVQLFYLNKRSSGYCEPWLISRGQRKLMMTVFARAFVAFTEERISGGHSSAIHNDVYTVLTAKT